MAVALEHAVRNLDTNRAALAALRARLWERLNEVASPVVLNRVKIDRHAIIVRSGSFTTVADTACILRKCQSCFKPNNLSPRGWRFLLTS